jgi:hypothetical protein
MSHLLHPACVGERGFASAAGILAYLSISMVGDGPSDGTSRTEPGSELPVAQYGQTYSVGGQGNTGMSSTTHCSLPGWLT